MNISRLKLLIIPALCNVVWSVNAMMSKTLVSEHGSVRAAWLRYASAAIAFWIIYMLKRFSQNLSDGSHSSSFAHSLKRLWGVQTRYWILALGFFPFFISPLLQLKGLEHAQSVDNIIIIAMEPLITVFFGWILLREQVSPFHKVCLLISTAGFSLLAKAYDRGASVHWFACTLMLLALIGESVYIVIGKKLSGEFEPLTLYGISVTFGAILLTLVTLGSVGLPSIEQLSLHHMGAMLWLGPLGTTICYVIWLELSQKLSLATLVITLFIQPVLGTFLGVWFMGDHLESLQWFGVSLIILSLVILSYEELIAAGVQDS
jgi:drug/metabolite transporter (DMT)-like permease